MAACAKLKLVLERLGTHAQALHENGAPMCLCLRVCGCSHTCVQICVCEFVRVCMCACLRVCVRKLQEK